MAFSESTREWSRSLKIRSHGYLKEPDDGCYEVSRAGERIELKPVGLGLTLEGILQTPADRN